MSGHRAVGQQHELLYQLIRILRGAEINAERLAVFINLKLHLLAVKGDSAFLKTAFAELLGEPIQRPERLRKPFPFLRYRLWLILLEDDRLRLFIAQAEIRADDRSFYRIMLHLCFIIQRKYYREGELIFVGPKRTNAITQALWEHRNGAINQIDRRSAVITLLVDNRARTHIVRDVSDMYAYFYRAILIFAVGKGIIEVLRIAGVDGESEHIAHVVATLNLAPADLLRNSFGRFLHNFRIAVRQPVFG